MLRNVFAGVPRFLFATCWLIVLFLPVPRVQAGDFDEATLAQIKARMQKFVADGHLVGAVTVVGSSNESHIAAVGQLHQDPTAAMSQDALFRIASMTKPITALALLLLAEQGKLAVTDPVQKHLPEFTGQMLVSDRTPERVTLVKPARPITLQDLLTHTSGLPGGYPPGLSDVYVKRNRTLAETTLAISQRPLEFQPGSRWSYCNPGIDTLGRVIEVVSGQSYESFLAKNIFQPLDMKDTTFFPTREQRKRVAGLYDVKEGKLVPAPDKLLGQGADARHPIPAGGLYSTGADVARFYRMMLRGGELDGKRILKADTVKELTTIHTGDLKTGFTSGMGFGYGFAVVKTSEGVTKNLSAGSFGHGGAFGTQSWADPKRDLLVVLLIQRVGLKNADASEMRSELQRLAVAARK